MNALLAWYFVAVWGSGYLATKIGLQYAPPFTFLSLRFAFGLLCLVPFVFFLRFQWPYIGRELCMVCVFGMVLISVVVV